MMTLEDAYQIYSGNTVELMACESSGSYQIKCPVFYKVTAVFVQKCEDTMDLSLFFVLLAVGKSI